MALIGYLFLICLISISNAIFTESFVQSLVEERIEHLQPLLNRESDRETDLYYSH